MRGSICLLLVACAPRLYSEDSSLDTPEPGGEWVAPENGWPMATPPAGLVGVGFSDGQVVPDVRGLDQRGDEVSLWQFYGTLMVIDISTIWCAPCQDLAAGAQETADDYADRDVQYVTVLQEDLDGNAPDRADLNAWGDLFGITAPILADGDLLMLQAIKQGSYPAVLLVDRKLRVVKRVNPVTDEQIREGLDQLL